MAHGETSPSWAARSGAAQTAETVAVLGAGGTMGFAMARYIAGLGSLVRAWNRSRSKAAPLAADGAYIADTPADAVAGAGIVLTMLADADAVITVMECDDGALPVMADTGEAEPPIWLQMSTIGEEATEWLHRAGLPLRRRIRGNPPVLGTRQPAERAELWCFESGPEEARPPDPAGIRRGGPLDDTRQARQARAPG